MAMAAMEKPKEARRWVLAGPGDRLRPYSLTLPHVVSSGHMISYVLPRVHHSMSVNDKTPK